MAENEEKPKNEKAAPAAPVPKNGNGAAGKVCVPFDKVEKGTVTVVKPYSTDTVCEPPARTFMVALRPNQPPLKLQADNPAEFVPYLKTTSLAWVNCRVSDLEKEAPAMAASLGFSTSLVESLLHHAQLVLGVLVAGVPVLQK